MTDLARKAAYRKAYYAANKEREIANNAGPAKKYREANRERIRAKKREDIRTNVERAMFRRAQYRASRKGIQFDIELSDIVIPAVCPVLGIPLFVSPERGYSANAPSLDRVDNTKGYIKGNVLVISSRANAIKRDASLGELLAVYEYMLNEIACPERRTLR